MPIKTKFVMYMPERSSLSVTRRPYTSWTVQATPAIAQTAGGLRPRRPRRTSDQASPAGHVRWRSFHRCSPPLRVTDVRAGLARCATAIGGREVIHTRLRAELFHIPETGPVAKELGVAPCHPWVHHGVLFSSPNQSAVIAQPLTQCGSLPSRAMSAQKSHFSTVRPGAGILGQYRARRRGRIGRRAQLKLRAGRDTQPCEAAADAPLVIDQDDAV